MALASYYNTGTASIANGSKAVTGQGTAWASIGLKPGDTFVGNDGRVGLIATVNSNTSLTLVANWPGTTQAASAYAIQPVAPGVDVGLVVASLLQTLNNGTLAGLATAGSSANKLGWYSAAGVTALLDFPSASRTRIAAGLGNAATGTVQSSATDTTSGRVLTVGAFGMGAAQSAITQTDLDNPALPTGIYRVASPTGLPAGTYALVNSNPTGAACSQRLERVNVAYGIYSRLSSAALTTSWTAEHVERGSNANGDYTRIGDGTQICRAALTIAYQNASVLAVTWTFPAAFSAAPSVFSQPMSAPVFARRGSTNYVSGVPSTTSAQVSMIDDAGSYTGGETMGVGAFAIGRWF